MHLRKARMPQGHTNLNKPTNSYSQLPMMTQTHVWDKTNSKFAAGVDTSFYQGARTNKNISKNKPSYKEGDKNEEINCQVLNHVRKAYKGKSNVWRIAKAWKFPEKGYIQKEQLRQQLQKTLKSEINEKQCADMFKFFSGNSNRLDLEQFLSLIFSQPRDTILQPKLYDIKDEKEGRNQKILNLIDHIEENPKKNILFDGAPNQSIQRKQRSLQSSFRSTKKSSEGQFFDKHSFSALSSSNLNKHLLNTKNLKENYDPGQFINTYQKKTRFGATPSNLMEKNVRQNHSYLEGSTYSNMKQNSEFVNRDNRVIERKLERIRECQRVEREKIEEIDKKLKIRDDGNLLRKRLQKEAYEYSAFLKNKWL